MPLAPRFLVNLWAGLLSARRARQYRDPRRDLGEQQRTFAHLRERLAATAHGRECGLHPGLTYAQFRDRVPLRPTAFFTPYAELMGAGEPDMLWPGSCRLFVETAGTTEESRHLPVTPEMLAHYRAALRDALLLYLARAGRTGVLDGRLVQVGASTQLTPVGTVHTGRLEAMLAHCLSPWAAAHLHAPPAEVSRLPEGPEKCVATAQALADQPVTLVGGPPAALLGTADAVRLAASRGKMQIPPLRALWPRLECVLHTGAPLGLFAEELRATFGPEVRFHELYAAAEGIIAAQDADTGGGLRLLAGCGLFFEFLPAADHDPARLAGLGSQCVPLAEAQVGVDYVLVLTTPAGLVRCVPGDIVRFVSLQPPRLVHAGRTQLRLNERGENVGEPPLTEALLAVCAAQGWAAVNFHVAPYYSRTAAGTPRYVHEWWVELRPGTVRTPLGPLLAALLDVELAARVPTYAARRSEGTIDTPVVRLVMPGLFDHWARGEGGGPSPSKMPRCLPDRRIADQLAEVARFATTEAPFGVPANATRRPFAPVPNPPPGSTHNPLQGSRVPFR